MWRRGSAVTIVCSQICLHDRLNYINKLQKNVPTFNIEYTHRHTDRHKTSTKECTSLYFIQKQKVHKTKKECDTSAKKKHELETKIPFEQKKLCKIIFLTKECVPVLCRKCCPW